MNVFRRAQQMGIETSYTDAAGHHREVDPPALEILIDSIPLTPAHPLLPEIAAVRSASPMMCDVSETAQLPVAWRIVSVDGKIAAQGRSETKQIAPPALPSGVYVLGAEDGAASQDERVVVVSPEPAFAGEFDRVWILAVQLYGIRSQHNWGIGDFSDLQSLIRWAADAGAAGIGLNPLHALFDDHPSDCSPYSPNSRLFLNPLYIDASALPEINGKFANDRAGEIEAAREAELVDYAAVAALKLQALQLAFETFKARTTLKRKTAFDEFRREQGTALSRFACFEVLRKKHAGPWWEWPSEHSAPDDAYLKKLREGPDARDIEFIEFVQWCADAQLKACSDLARKLNMPVGLYLDVAVGVKADGFDAWNEQVAISRRLSVGAPPDLLNTVGQDWGLAGFNSTGLQLRAFAPFRQMLRASMRHAGAIRLDHVLGLNRLYLVPSGYLPSQGAYVRMPFELLLAVTALESVAQKCIVIGEDLGTVPDGFRDRLAAWGVWSYRVMMFERDHDGAFLPIERYPQNALVTFNTHDLPTFAGWQSGQDLQVKQSLGLDPGESHDARVHAHRKLGDALAHADLGEANFHSAVNFLSRTPSRMLAVAIEDLLGVIDQPNIPGTIDEHPNWRRRMPAMIEEWNERIDAERLKGVLSERSAG